MLVNINESRRQSAAYRNIGPAQVPQPSVTFLDPPYPSGSATYNVGIVATLIRFLAGTGGISDQLEKIVARVIDTRGATGSCNSNPESLIRGSERRYRGGMHPGYFRPMAAAIQMESWMPEARSSASDRMRPLPGAGAGDSRLAAVGRQLHLLQFITHVGLNDI